MRRFTLAVELVLAIYGGKAWTRFVKETFTRAKAAPTKTAPNK